MRAGVGFLLAVLGVAGCVSAPSGMAPMSHSCVTTITGPDGKPQQAVIEADDAGAAAALCAGAPLAPPPKAALPDVAGVAQTRETKDLGGGRSVVTYTYGTPPGAARSKPPVPVQQRPAPLSGDNALVHRRAAHGPGCTLRMVGGTGYVCASQ